MSDETTTPSDQNEIIDLGFDMNEVDLSRPVLKDTTKKATVSFTRKETSKNGHPMLLVGYKLTEPAENTKGETVNPGFGLTQRLLLQPTGKMTQKMINERLGAIHFAATGQKEGKPSTDQWIGKTVAIRIKLREERTDEKTGQTYPPSNEVSNVYPVKEGA